MALQEELEIQGNYLFKYRSYFPIIVVVAGLFVYYFSYRNNVLFDLTYANEKFVFHHWYHWLCLGVATLGQLIRIYIVGYTPANTSGRNTKKQIADELNTTGIYSMLRHPLYFGNFFMWLGLIMLTLNLWFILCFCLAYWIYYERIMFAEEQFLRGKFKEAYLEWAEKVPPFIPKVKNYQKPKYNFCWKKVLKKEKNGVFALFLLFLIPEQIIEFDVYGTLFQHSWMMYPTIVSGILYFILKFLKYKTNFLVENN